MSATVDVPAGEFDHVYHALRTEEPVYLDAVYGDGDGPIHDLASVGLTTELEMVGGGSRDASPDRVGGTS